MSFWAGLGQLATDIIPGLVSGGITAKQNQKNRQWQSGESQKERDFNAEQAQLTRDHDAQKYQMTVEDMRSAGLNPALMYGKGGSGATATSAQASAQASKLSNQQDIATSMQNAITTAVNQQRKKKENEVADSQIDINKSLAEKTEAESNSAQAVADYNKTYYDEKKKHTKDFLQAELLGNSVGGIPRLVTSIVGSKKNATAKEIQEQVNQLQSELKSLQNKLKSTSNVRTQARLKQQITRIKLELEDLSK